jgi:hypothetical protein
MPLKKNQVVPVFVSLSMLPCMYQEELELDREFRKPSSYRSQPSLVPRQWMPDGLFEFELRDSIQLGLGRPLLRLTKGKHWSERSHNAQARLNLLRDQLNITQVSQEEVAQYL